MIILGFANLLTRATKPRYDEDMVDRLNNRVAAYILIAAGITIFGNNLGGKPMQCWDKPNWIGSWSEYASDYCFIEGTYFVPLNETLPKEDGYENLKKVTYYQWTPFILTILGVLFTLPRSLWSFVNWSSSFYMQTILTEGSKTKKNGKPSREFIKFSTIHIGKILKNRYRCFSKDSTVIKRAWARMFSSYYLTAWYILMKVLNIICALTALITMSNFVADDSTSFLGTDTIRALTRGEDWRNTGHFPRLTICRFNIRESGIFDETVMAPKITQCVLLTNMYIEKIYIVVWYGLVFLLFANIINLARFIYLLLSGNRESFLNDMLKPALDYVLPELDSEFHWEGKSRHHSQHVTNKLKQLKTAEKQGNTDEIEAAMQHYIEAKEKDVKEKQEAMKKRSKKRRMFQEYLQNDLLVFVNHIGADGYLTIRLLYANAGMFIAGAMGSRLFWNFAKEQDKNRS